MGGEATRAGWSHGGGRRRRRRRHRRWQGRGEPPGAQRLAAGRRGVAGRRCGPQRAARLWLPAGRQPGLRRRVCPGLLGVERLGGHCGSGHRAGPPRGAAPRRRHGPRHRSGSVARPRRGHRGRRRRHRVLGANPAVLGGLGGAAAGVRGTGSGGHPARLVARPRLGGGPILPGGDQPGAGGSGPADRRARVDRRRGPGGGAGGRRVAGRGSRRCW